MATTRTSSLSSVTLAALSDELQKIAATKQPQKPDKMKRFLKSTLALSLGTGAGVGAAELVHKAADKAFGPKWATLSNPTKRRLLGAGLGLASAGAYVAREWNAHERREAMK